MMCLIKSSYTRNDVIMLLKDLSNVPLEGETLEREKRIQSGQHYSETLPSEKLPSPGYLDLFRRSLDREARDLATLTGLVSELIVNEKGTDLILVSLARAGTPIGILIKRYLKYRYQLDIPHYSVSIIRGAGLDGNAIKYIRKHHRNSSIQFIDGWTGKGSIQKELTKSVKSLNEQFGFQLDDQLAVLADPADCASLYGTKNDIFIPSACLNSTVSGLISRTVLNRLYIEQDDFHGAKYYQEWEEDDVSREFVEVVCSQFPAVSNDVQTCLISKGYKIQPPLWRGMKDIEVIKHYFNIQNAHFIKPGIGETTRVLLRRHPWKVLMKDIHDPNLEHIRMLAKEKDVPIEPFADMEYKCCGIIKPMQAEK
ncbi:cysteine protease StiP family protein [Falsibacillus albus]|uniref:Uncharacterized protein n=1 Tax=Falsibacillus albus TaxID=2478915 RepID=A0A3L7JXM5_9BACI|nr:cysteine protease StiP family protein [Falsibacillus albus]RLQ95526.1 hypothetical protein D9X91_10880 [Falsibacillus albus]